MVCNNSNHHSPHCPNYKNNKLKGASAVPPKQLLFTESELNLLDKSLEICRYFITENQNLYQNPEDILKELSIASNIVNARQSNIKSNLNGASSKNICNEKKIQSLQNLLKQFNLT